MRIIQVPDPDAVIEVSKEPAEKETYVLDMTPVTKGLTSVASVGTITITPSTGGNPTVTAGTVGSQTVPISVDGGLATWNTNGRGTAVFVVTMANGDKAEINMGITIKDLVP